MGCNNSKGATVDVYRPPPSSFAVFDINSIQEPWLSGDNSGPEKQEKPTNLPSTVLEKLNKLESETPHSWEEVSKALEDIKQPPPAPALPSATGEKKQPPVKSQSFHTLEELDAKLTPKPQPLKKTESLNNIRQPPPPPITVTQANNSGDVIKPVRENIFVMRDRMEREKEGKMAYYEKKRSDPLSEYPDKCPPGGTHSVVVYTTSLRGVRRTYEDCERVRTALEGQRVVFDERDVSLHNEYLNELKGILGDEASLPLPRLFVKGKYIGGVKEVVELDESGRLGRILNRAGVEKGIGRQACEGCGGARFVPCLDCGGSCKVVIDGVKDRCGKCNENGLILCPLCL